MKKNLGTILFGVFALSFLIGGARSLVAHGGTAEAKFRSAYPVLLMNQTEINTQIPSSLNYLVINTTVGVVCISTGTANAMQYKNIAGGSCQ